MAFKNYSRKSNKEINYKVLKVFGILDSNSKMPKELRLISWNGADPKYDIRGWGKDEFGNETMTKGITLDSEEIQSLYDILTEISKDDEDDMDYKNDEDYEDDESDEYVEDDI